MRSLVLLATVAGVAHAGPGTITIDVKNESLRDLATKLTSQSGCQVTAFGGGTVDLSVSGATLWEVLGELEAKQKIYSRMSFGMIALETGSSPRRPGVPTRDPQLSWATDWRSRGPWAIALVGGHSWGTMSPPPNESRARLIFVGQFAYTIDKVVIDAASADKKPIKLTTSIKQAAPCQLSEIELAIPAAAVSTLSVRGTLHLKKTKIIERKVAVPVDDSVIDLSEGRLRIHIASKPAGTGQREVHVGWDNMGDPIRISTDIVDEQGGSVRALGIASGGSSGSQGHEDRTVATGGKLFVVIKLPSGSAGDEKLPFRFDDEKLSP